MKKQDLDNLLLDKPSSLALKVWLPFSHRSECIHIHAMLVGGGGGGGGGGIFLFIIIIIIIIIIIRALQPKADRLHLQYKGVAGKDTMIHISHNCRKEMCEL